MTHHDATVGLEPVPYRPWWPVWMFATIGGLFASLTVGFTLITSSNRAEESERRAERAERRAEIAETRNAEAQARVDCRALFAAEIDDADLVADRAEHALIALVARQLISTTPPDPGAFLATIERMEAMNEAATAETDARREWLEAGSPLPCPLEP